MLHLLLRAKTRKYADQLNDWFEGDCTQVEGYLSLYVRLSIAIEFDCCRPHYLRINAFDKSRLPGYRFFDYAQDLISKFWLPFCYYRYPTFETTEDKLKSISVLFEVKERLCLSV